MKAKLIYEKFTEDSDPIQDLGIGFNIKRDFESQKDLVEWLVNNLHHILRLKKIPNDIIIDTSFYIKKKYLDVIENYIFKYITVNGSHVCHWYMLRDALFKKGYKLTDKIEEKFAEEGDPIHDMHIGTHYLIEKWLKKHNIDLYKINNDYTIDVDGDVDLNNKLHKNLPEYINFNYVSGKFTCENNYMTTLRGCPKITSWYFSCACNKLTSLNYIPKKASHVYCYDNKKQFTVKDVLEKCVVEITIFVHNVQYYDWKEGQFTYYDEKKNKYIY
jgi:hypothetical protein